MRAFNILIVEDVTEAEVALKQRLTDLNFNVLTTVSSPSRILENPMLSQADIVLMDLFLDEPYSGLNACRDINNIKGIPVVLMIGNDNLKFNILDEVNAYNVMYKPFSDVELYYNLRAAAGIENKNKKLENGFKSKQQDFLFVKMDYKLHKIAIKDIIYIEAHKDYVDIITNDKKFIVNVTMYQIEQALPSDIFVRTQRGFIVNIGYIEYIKFPEIKLEKIENSVLIGGNYKKSVFQKLNLL